MFCFSDWSTCQLSPNAVCGSGIKTRMLDCVRSDGKSVDIKFCEEVRRAQFLFRSVLLMFVDTHSRTTIHGGTLPVLLAPQHYEIFTSIHMQRLYVPPASYSFMRCLGFL